MKNLEKMIALFLFFTALSIVLFWTLSLISGLPPNINEEIISFTFQRIAETLLFIMSAYVAVLLFKNKLNIKLPVFLNLGLLLCAAFQGSFYYAVKQPELLIFLFMFAFFIIALFFTWAGLKKFYVIGMSRGQGKAFNYAFLLFGIIIYYMLNLSGNHLQGGESGAFLIDVFILLNAGYFATAGLKKSRFSLNL